MKQTFKKKKSKENNYIYIYISRPLESTKIRMRKKNVHVPVTLYRPYFDNWDKKKKGVNLD